MKSILLIRYSALGDVVLATSVIAPLRQKYPAARISWVTDVAYAGLLEGLVDQVITFRRDDGASLRSVLREVTGQFEFAIDLQDQGWSQRVAHAAAGHGLGHVRRAFGSGSHPEQRIPFLSSEVEGPSTPLRYARGDRAALLAQDESHTRAFSSPMDNDIAFDQTPATQLYATAAQLDQPGVVRLSVSSFATSRAAELLPEAGWVAVAPGASREAKRWPAQRLAEVAATLRAEGHRIVLVGGAMDGAVLDMVRAGCTLDADVTAESLAVVAAALGRTELLIGNDSGLAHVAAGMGCPALVLFGPTSVQRWGPRAPGAALSLGLPCAPCSNVGPTVCHLGHHDCLQKLETSAVLTFARQLLNHNRAGSSTL